MPGAEPQDFLSRGPLWAANEILALVVEVFALAALCYWGFTASHQLAVRILLGIGAPVVAVVLWGLFAAPRARIRLPLAGVLVVKAVVFGAAAAGLIAAGHPVLGIVFAVVAVANTTLAETNRRRPTA